MDNIRNIFYPHFPHLLSDLCENMYNSMNICRLADKWPGLSLLTINCVFPGFHEGGRHNLVMCVVPCSL
jgi:hypothetical protein